LKKTWIKNFVENLKFIKEDYKKLDDKILKLFNTEIIDIKNR
jgi:hypothetical protein